MFHHFHGQTHPVGQGSIDASTLHRMLDFIGNKHILTPKEWMDKARKNTLEQGDVCLTFDDGLACQYDIAVPVLRERGLRAFFFIPSSPLVGTALPLEIYRHVRNTCFDSVEKFYETFREHVLHSAYASEYQSALSVFDAKTYLSAFDFYTDADREFRFVRDNVLGPKRYREIMNTIVETCFKRSGIDARSILSTLWMTEEHLRTLAADGHAIGLHSHTHPTVLGTLSPEEQTSEYRTNMSVLTDIAKESIRSMSHPCNSYSADTLRILKDLGIRIGFRSMMQGGSGSLLELPREDHSHIMSLLHTA